jgi:hypothetical protein
MPKHVIKIHQSHIYNNRMLDQVYTFIWTQPSDVEIRPTFHRFQYILCALKKEHTEKRKQKQTKQSPAF